VAKKKKLPGGPSLATNRSARHEFHLLERYEATAEPRVYVTVAGRTNALSGLVDAARRLRRVPGIAVVRLQDVDIVRHRLVQAIVNAYGSGQGH